jgi:hypothetical protein
MDHGFLLGITPVSFSSTRAHTENEEIKFRNFHGYVLIWMWNHKLLLRIQDSGVPGYSIALPTLPPPPQASENSAVNCRTFQLEFQQHPCRSFFTLESRQRFASECKAFCQHETYRNLSKTLLSSRFRFVCELQKKSRTPHNMQFMYIYCSMLCSRWNVCKLQECFFGDISKWQSSREVHNSWNW